MTAAFHGVGQQSVQLVIDLPRSGSKGFSKSEISREEPPKSGLPRVGSEWGEADSTNY